MLKQFIVCAVVAVGFLAMGTEQASAHSGIDGTWELNYPEASGATAIWTFSKVGKKFVGFTEVEDEFEVEIKSQMSGVVYFDEYFVADVVTSDSEGNFYPRGVAIFGLAPPKLIGYLIEFVGPIPVNIIELDGDIYHAPH